MKTTVSPFAIVSALFQSIAASVEAANRFDLAYYVGTGKPQDHVPFDESEPEKVAVNLAGLYAADSFATALACKDGGTEEAYVDALRRIVDEELTDEEKILGCVFANATWRAGQPFRGISTSPLARLAKPVNMQFLQLPAEERAKDAVQIQTGATLLLEAVDAESDGV